MSIVNVNTELLTSGSSSTKISYEKNKDTYDRVNGMSIPSCTSFDSFKTSLKAMFDTYTSHVEIISKKLNECAEKLEELDNSIASNVTNTLVFNNDEFNGKVGFATTTSTVSSEYVNPYDPDNLPDETLYDTKGVLTFYQNGKFVKETFCHIPLKHSLDLKFLILKMGYDAGFWYREDGVQMWGEDVMYGGCITEWGPGGIEDENRNTANSPRRRGDKFYGTSGPGRIVGTGGTSKWAMEGNFYFDNKKVDETYDTYTAWLIDDQNSQYLNSEEFRQYQKYNSRYYNKQEEYATRNVIDNPPVAPSERYYQTNKDWVELFGKYTLTREYIPDGVVDWNTDEWKTFDWEAYFQINNPDRVSA